MFRRGESYFQVLGDTHSDLGPQWNVWDPIKAKPTHGNEQIYDYTDMLGFVSWLNILVRQSHDCPVACLAQSVNDVGCICRTQGSPLKSRSQIAPIILKPDGILYQSIYWP